MTAVMTDRLGPEPVPSGDDAVLPEPEPILVTPTDDAAALIRSARAEIARLTLEWRSALREAEAAEAEAHWSAGAAGAAGESSSTMAAALKILRDTVEPHLDARRLELAAEVERARGAAARRVADARLEAKSIVEAARAELMDVVLGAGSRAPAVEDR